GEPLLDPPSPLLEDSLLACGPLFSESSAHSKASKFWNSEDVFLPPLFQKLARFSSLFWKIASGGPSITLVSGLVTRVDTISSRPGASRWRGRVVPRIAMEGCHDIPAPRFHGSRRSGGQHDDSPDSGGRPRLRGDVGTRLAASWPGTPR